MADDSYEKPLKDHVPHVSEIRKLYEEENENVYVDTEERLFWFSEEKEKIFRSMTDDDKKRIAFIVPNERSRLQDSKCDEYPTLFRKFMIRNAEFRIMFVRVECIVAYRGLRTGVAIVAIE